MPGTVSLSELPPDVRAKLGVRKPRARRSMDMNAVRSYSIRVLAVLADLTPTERARILRHALKVNAV